jgi:RNA polymerase sigma factor (TIGR02999 family)
MGEPPKQRGTAEVQHGASCTAEKLLPEIYAELRRLAFSKLARERPGQTLQPTALVHEAWLRLSSSSAPTWEGRTHFFGAAAEAMRRILVDNARRKKRLRHGGGCECVNCEAVDIASPMPDEELLALDEALTQLATVDREAAELVKLRFFTGLTQSQAAEQLGVSRSTADRTWVFARAWLFHRLRSS